MKKQLVLDLIEFTEQGQMSLRLAMIQIRVDGSIHSHQWYRLTIDPAQGPVAMLKFLRDRMVGTTSQNAIDTVPAGEEAAGYEGRGGKFYKKLRGKGFPDLSDADKDLVKAAWKEFRKTDPKAKTALDVIRIDTLNPDNNEIVVRTRHRRVDADGDVDLEQKQTSSIFPDDDPDSVLTSMSDGAVGLGFDQLPEEHKEAVRVITRRFHTPEAKAKFVAKREEYLVNQLRQVIEARTLVEEVTTNE